VKVENRRRIGADKARSYRGEVQLVGGPRLPAHFPIVFSASQSADRMIPERGGLPRTGPRCAKRRGDRGTTKNQWVAGEAADRVVTSRGEAVARASVGSGAPRISSSKNKIFIFYYNSTTSTESRAT
jgi:hypothetical protein